jgi:hypothetical protein
MRPGAAEDDVRPHKDRIVGRRFAVPFPGNGRQSASAKRWRASFRSFLGQSLSRLDFRSPPAHPRPSRWPLRVGAGPGMAVAASEEIRARARFVRPRAAGAGREVATCRRCAATPRRLGRLGGQHGQVLGQGDHPWGIWEFSVSASWLPEMRGNLVHAGRGIGRDLIVRFLKETPGINDDVVQHQLANLKSSGEYARSNVQRWAISVTRWMLTEEITRRLVIRAKMVRDAGAPAIAADLFAAAARLRDLEREIELMRMLRTAAPLESPPQPRAAAAK